MISLLFGYGYYNFLFKKSLFLCIYIDQKSHEKMNSLLKKNIILLMVWVALLKSKKLLRIYMEP